MFKQALFRGAWLPAGFFSFFSLSCSSPSLVVKKGDLVVIASSPSLFEDAAQDAYQASATIDGLGTINVTSLKLDKDQTEVANAYFTAETAKRMISSTLAGKRSDNSLSKVRSNNSLKKAGIEAKKAVSLKSLEVPIQ